MKILVVGNVDFSVRQFLLPLMRGLRSRGHDVIAVAADGPLLAPVRAEGFRVEPVPMARTFSPLAQWRAFRALLALIRHERPDLVHGNFPIAGLQARFAAWLLGVPRITYTCHGFLFNQPGSWTRRLLSVALEWAAGKITDVYMTVSAKEADDARRLGIARGAVAIGNGRDPARFHPDPAMRHAVRAALGVPDEQVVIIIVSRLVVEKGYLELLAAMREVPDAALWVVGVRLPTDRGPDLAPVFAASGLGERLRLLGYRDDIPALLQAADIFVLPSHFEAQPMSVIEAMLTGLPVVASDVGGPREQVVDGVTGLLVPPRQVAPLAAALNRLVAEPALRRSLGAAGLARARERFDEARIVTRMLDLLGA